MEELIRFIVAKLVDEPDAIRVTTTIDEEGVNTILLSVASDDIGKVIGKQGRIAKALRTIVRASSKDGTHYRLDIDSDKDE